MEWNWGYFMVGFLSALVGGAAALLGAWADSRLQKRLDRRQAVQPRRGVPY